MLAPMSAEPAVYLDSSALVKLVVHERETDALRRYLRRVPERVSCALARVEVVRAVRPQGRSAVARARLVLERVSLLALDETRLDSAARLDGEALRSLDPIHLAAAQSLGSELSAVVTYDVRMASAARRLGLRVAGPE